MAVYKRDIADINLETGNIHRTFLNHSIGLKDQKADHFGVRVFRDGEPVNLSGVSVQGVFMPPQGSPIAITSGNIVSGNVAEVVLPQACYNYDGQFCLAIKLVDATNSVTGTVRIVDGMVDNTHASGTVAPTSAVPTYQEVLSVYEQAIAAISTVNAMAGKMAVDITAGAEATSNNSFKDLGNRWMTFRRGYYSTPSAGSTSSYTDDVNYVYALVACAPGDVLHAHGYGDGTSKSAWAFLDSSLKILDKGGSGNYEGATDPAPTSTAFALVNVKLASLGSGYYGWIGAEAIKDQIATLKDAVSEDGNIIYSRDLKSAIEQVEDVIDNSCKETVTGDDNVSGSGLWWGFRLAEASPKIIVKPEFSTDRTYTLYRFENGVQVSAVDYAAGEAFEACDVQTTTRFFIKPFGTGSGVLRYTETEPNTLIKPLLSYYNSNTSAITDMSYWLGGTYIDYVQLKTLYKEAIDNSKKFDKVESDVNNIEDGLNTTYIIPDDDIATSGLSWGFYFSEPHYRISFKPKFQSDAAYTVNRYENGALLKTIPCEAGEYCTLDNILTTTTIIISTSVRHYYSETEPTGIKPNLAYVQSGTIKTSAGNYYACTIIEMSYDLILKQIKNDVSNLEKKSLLGKKITVIGDSITEYNFRAAKNWPMWLSEKTGCVIQNLGVSGTGFTTGNNKYYNRISSVNSDADIIGVAISFNDLDYATAHSISIGNIIDSTETTVMGYINVFFDKLEEDFPNTPIICYVQNPWYQNTNPSHPSYRYGETYSDEYVNKVKELLALRGIPFYGGMYYKGSVLKPWFLANREEYFTSDNESIGNTGVVDTDHPNSNGHHAIFNYLREKFIQNVLNNRL